MGRLDPNDPRKSYVQVAEALRELVRNGTYKPGHQLPSNQALADEFGVSVGTARRAISELQNENLVISKQGQATFVRTAVPDEDSLPPSDLSLRDLYIQLTAVQARLAIVEQKLEEPSS